MSRLPSSKTVRRAHLRSRMRDRAGKAVWCGVRTAPQAGAGGRVAAQAYGGDGAPSVLAVLRGLRGHAAPGRAGKTGADAGRDGVSSSRLPNDRGATPTPARATQTADGNLWMTGACWLYCRREGARVLRVGSVSTPGATGDVYACGPCIAELDRIAVLLVAVAAACCAGNAHREKKR